MFSLLITEIAKFNVGRLRPHYITLLIKECNFELTSDICYGDFGQDNFNLKMVNLTEVLKKCPNDDDIADGMKSFSSGMFLKINKLLDGYIF